MLAGPARLELRRVFAQSQSFQHERRDADAARAGARRECRSRRARDFVVHDAQPDASGSEFAAGICRTLATGKPSDILLHKISSSTFTFM